MNGNLTLSGGDVIFDQGHGISLNATTGNPDIYRNSSNCIIINGPTAQLSIC